MAGETKYQQLQRRKSALWNERSSWDSHYKELAKFQFPRGGRFETSETNKGDKKHGSIYDSTASFALRTLAAGMMSGVTSPARPWFRLALADKDLMEYGPVKAWLHQVAELMRAVFNSSNTYNALHSCYEELGAFGTWSDIVLPDFDNVLHHYPLTVGEYALSTNFKGQVDTLVREFRMTPEQMIGMFGREACSMTVRNLYDTGNYSATIDVVHAIHPRKFEDRDYGKKDAQNMAFASCYIEAGKDVPEQYLRESGFKRFPALCPRWTVTGGDVYGRSPGMDALGDTKQLQHQQLRKSQAIDYQVNPPLQVPTNLKDKAAGRLPGGVSYYDGTGPGSGIRTAYEVNARLDYLLTDIQDVRERIKTAYYADLFLMLANDTRSGITATEVAERHEEKLLMLGPVLERLQNELLSPLIDIAFDRLAEAGVLPEAPQELQGRNLDIEFISTLAQAQRAVAASGMERLFTSAINMAQAKPEVLDKLDFDQAIDDMADMFGVNPALVVPDDKAAEERAKRAQAMAAQQAAAAAPVAVDSAKTASEIDTSNLRDVLGSLQGYGTSTPQYVQ